MKTDLKDMTMKELTGWFEEAGEKSFRAGQVFKWMSRGVIDFDEMTDLSKALREKLKEDSVVGDLKTDTVRESETDETKKFLFELNDGDHIETVFMKYKYGNSVCVSSQAGCRMGCSFCASTVNGLARDLTAGEMADQIICVERYTGEKIGHVVVMGSGEPLENYEELSRFLEIIHDRRGLDIGMRNITVSTCGIVPGIEKIGNDFPQVNLAISLHAPDDGLRNEIMPINRKYDLKMLMKACREHIEKTGRRITFEYVLIAGKNDSAEQIKRLAAMLKGMNCHVNLIPLNAVEEAGMHKTSRTAAADIEAFLQSRGIQATVRRELGSDIDAACGQLRLRKNGRNTI
ncbi:MAG: 23S rRNA (adenine(2503)-C(2))-methyltransferase RlmN [Eubacteriaceae bacterium]|nr:23S rRNA (adenine(2503)-C(2))-methyltransferase RlmN [Eubacteriaceae bacterium]